ncbi:MAG: recombinase family protein [Deltaproteobacteria bacterium]|nr:recombinase family protein [Deltaproteobacteria bacterium]
MKRPGLISLLNAGESGEFDVVVLRDESRLGGDTYRTGLVLQDLVKDSQTGIQDFTDEEVLLETATDKVMVAIRNFAAELEREKVSQRTRENHKYKAKKGYVTGGKVFGYRNVEAKDPSGKRAYVTYEIDPVESLTVIKIFEMYADGVGLRGIARKLNADRVPAPRAEKRGGGSWGQSVVRAMLRNERYRGVLSWGRITKGHRKGTKVRFETDASERVEVHDASLAIISENL